MKLYTTSVLAGLVMLGTVGATQAATIVDATDPTSILAIAQDYGSARLGEDDAGDPEITGQIDGISYAVTFYGCDSVGQECKTLLFNASFYAEQGLSFEERLERTADWNGRKIYGRLSLDEDNDYKLDMAVNLAYGVTEENLDDTFDWWKVVMGQFKEF